MISNLYKDDENAPFTKFYGCAEDSHTLYVFVSEHINETSESTLQKILNLDTKIKLKYFARLFELLGRMEKIVLSSGHLIVKELYPELLQLRVDSDNNPENLFLILDKNIDSKNSIEDIKYH